MVRRRVGEVRRRVGPHLDAVVVTVRLVVVVVVVVVEVVVGPLGAGSEREKTVHLRTMRESTRCDVMCCAMVWYAAVLSAAPWFVPRRPDSSDGALVRPSGPHLLLGL